MVGSAHLVAAAPPAAACSCAGGDDAEFIEHADAIFRGSVIDRIEPAMPASSADPVVWVFDVATVYKGSVAATQGVASPMRGASCGLELRERDDVLVFANRDAGIGGRIRGVTLYSYLCGGTRSVGDGVPEQLEEGMAPRPGSDGIARIDTTTGFGGWVSVGATLALVAVAAATGCASRRRWRRKPA